MKQPNLGYADVKLDSVACIQQAMHALYLNTTKISNIVYDI